MAYLEVQKKKKKKRVGCKEKEWIIIQLLYLKVLKKMSGRGLKGFEEVSTTFNSLFLIL